MADEKMDKSFADAFGAIDKLNDDSSILADGALSTVNGYIDTGSFALNAITTGSIYKGIPKGRITGLVGPTGCGKTLILNKIIANAQKDDPELWGVIWDSEAAHDADAARSVGANPAKIKHNPVETVEECRNQIAQFLEKVIANPKLHGKFVIGIDSLGNLASMKEIEDARKGKSATDMGTKAKAIKSMMRTLTYKCAKAGVTLIFTNHIYDDPASLFPSLIKNQSGGKGPLYLASLLIQLAVKQDKKEDKKDTKDVIPIANRVKGVVMRALTVKNRFIPPFLETNLFLNFKSGLYKYTGLLDMAVAYGVVIQTGATYQLADGTKLGYAKVWKNNATIWDEKILPALDEVLMRELTFSNSSDELEQEVDDIDDEDETNE